MKTRVKKAIYGLLGLAGVILVFILALVVPSTTIFQGKLPVDDQSACKSLKLISLPDPIKSYENATIVIQTEPLNWDGNLRATTSGGSLSDNKGKEGAFINTTERILSFSGADADTRITLQALGRQNENCIASLTVTEREKTACNSLSVEIYPSPLPSNESAEFTLSTNPENWAGSFLIQAESGKLTLLSADNSALGQNSNLLITSNNKIIYNGGKEGEQIRFNALGEENRNCAATVTIGP